MKQALIKKGRVLPVEVPAPQVSPNSVLVKVVNSCISAGTEKTNISESKKSLIKHAFEQPEKILIGLDMLKNEGPFKTYANIKQMTSSYSPTGYSASGIVIGVGETVEKVSPGDYVTISGAGIANHAEFVDAPINLVTPIPKGLDFKKASTVTIGAIAMQGVRRANASLGEFVVVFGVGLLGQLSIQMLAASGVRIIAVDICDKRLQLASNSGAEKTINLKDEDGIKSVQHFTGGYGADITLFCAATDESQTLSDAFAMTRKKGRLVMVGVWGSKLRREDIYTKEIDFLISTSYGPGRYDENYEKKGLDYPYHYIRWTENRNMQEYLRLLSTNTINIEPLIDSIHSINNAEEAFKELDSEKKPMIVLLDYGKSLPDNYSQLEHKSPITINGKHRATKQLSSKIKVGIIGAGSFAQGVHLPNLNNLSNYYSIHAICTQTGSTSKSIAQQYDAAYATSNYMDIINDNDIDLIMICTRHNLHGQMVLDSLLAGKHTFVEKPLCTKLSEMKQIGAFYKDTSKPDLNNKPLLMAGFNRRFSKYIKEIKKHTNSRINPLMMHYRMNAGYLPLDHWVHTNEGGGRIVGEACHIIDLFSYIVDAPLKSYSFAGIKPKTTSISTSDNKSIIFEYEDGSIASLDYISIGSNKLDKEYLEIHYDEKSIVMNNYTSLKGFGVKLNEFNDKTPCKGQFDELEILAKCLTGNKSEWPIALESLLETTELSILCK